jgi:hypothetical protein
MPLWTIDSSLCCSMMTVQECRTRTSSERRSTGPLEEEMVKFKTPRPIWKALRHGIINWIMCQAGNGTEIEWDGDYSLVAISNGREVVHSDLLHDSSCIPARHTIDMFGAYKMP